MNIKGFLKLLGVAGLVGSKASDHKSDNDFDLVSSDVIGGDENVTLEEVDVGLTGFSEMNTPRETAIEGLSKQKAKSSSKEPKKIFEELKGEYAIGNRLFLERKTEKYREALHYFDGIIASFNDVEDFSQLGFESEKAFNQFGAKVYFDRAFSKKYLGMKEEALLDMQHVMQLDPNMHWLQHDFGTLLFDVGKFAEASEAFSKEIEVNPNANSYYERGATYLLRNLYSQAIDDFQEALRLNPQQKWAHNDIGFAYQKLGQYELALESYQSELKINDAENVHQNIAEVEFLIERKSQEEAQQSSVNDQDVEAEVEKSEMEKMVELQKQAQRIYKHDSYILMREDNPRFSAFMEAHQKHEQVIHYFDEAIKANPSEPMLHYYRGLSRLSAGWSESTKLTDNDEGAFADFRQEMKINPHSPMPHIAMGDAYFYPRDQRKSYIKALELNAKKPVLDDAERERLETFVEYHKNVNSPLYDLLSFVVKGGLLVSAISVVGGAILVYFDTPERRTQGGPTLQEVSDLIKQNYPEMEGKKEFITEAKEIIKLSVGGALSYDLGEDDIGNIEKESLTFVASLQLCQLFSDLLKIRCETAFNQDRLALFNDRMADYGMNDEQKEQIKDVMTSPLEQISTYIWLNYDQETYLEKNMRGAFHSVTNATLHKKGFGGNIFKDFQDIAIQDSVAFLEKTINKIAVDIALETVENIVDTLDASEVVDNTKPISTPIPTAMQTAINSQQYKGAG